MGNSEVGHLNLGAGAVVKQDLTRIDEAVERRHAGRERGPASTRWADAERVHLIGLVSDGGVHSGWTHLRGADRPGRRRGVPDLVIHAFTDGRDTLPHGGAGYLETVAGWCDEAGVGRIGSVIGRYFAMDRDKRWERTQKALRPARPRHRRAPRRHRRGGGRGGLRARRDRRVHHRRRPSATRRRSARGTASSPSTSAPTACARSPRRSPIPASTRSTAAAPSRSSATRR